MIFNMLKLLVRPLSFRRGILAIEGLPDRTALDHRNRRQPPDIEYLESRVMLNGLTIITHGFNDNINGWVTAMGDAVAAQANAQGGEAARIIITASQSFYGAIVIQEASPYVPADYNGQVIIEFDWSSISAAPTFTTGAIANALANFLYTTYVNHESVLEGSIHLIGHSRGGSLVAALADDLGTHGLWVDQLTTLDPHPILLDAPISLSNNVIFSDNYYETSTGLDEFPVDGAANFGPLSLGGGTTYGFPGYEHNDVHLYYQGTIGASTFDGSYNVPDTWYSANGVSHDSTGFYYSLIAGGLRPANGIGAGFSALASNYDLQGYGDRQQIAVADMVTPQQQWPNIAQLQPMVTSNLTIGQPLGLNYSYEDNANNFSVLFSLDTDQNPYNNNSDADALITRASNRNVTATGANIKTSQIMLDTAGLTAGKKYYICAEIMDNGHKRYAYYSTSLTFLPAFPAAPAPTISSVTPPQFLVPSSGTTPITIFGTGFTPSSTLVFIDPANNPQPAKSAPTYVSSTQLRYAVNVSGAAGTWKVEVVDNGQKSNQGSFFVQPPAMVSAPAAPTLLTVAPSGWSKSSQYTISWTNPGTGLAKVWVKVGTAPAFASDGTSYAYPSSKSLSINIAQDGYQAVFVWFEDSAGNKSANNYNVVAIERDTVGPQLVITVPSATGSWTSNDGAILLSGTASDSLSGLDSVTWSNSRGGNGVATMANGSWNAASPILLSDGVNVVTVSATDKVGNASTRTIQITHNAISIVPQNPLPAPGDINVARLNPVFSWSGSALGGVSYALALYKAGALVWGLGFGETNGSSATYSGPLDPGATYTWQVQARNSSGTVATGPMWQFTTANSQPDVLPIGLTLDGAPAPGATVTAHLTVLNNGNFPSPGINAKLYFSHTAGAKEILFGLPSGISVPNLNPGQQTTIDFPVTLNGMFAGPGAIDAWIDCGPYASGESRLDDKTISIPINYVDAQPPIVTEVAMQFSALTGHTANIIYSANDDIGVTTLDFYSSVDGGGSWQAIATGVNAPSLQNATTYQWAVPSNFPITNNLKLKVVAHDAAGNTGELVSSTYSSVDGTAPAVSLTSPTGGEVWDIGTTHTISWNLSAPNGIRLIYLDFEHGSTIEAIQGTEFSSNPGSYSWTIPNTASAVTTTGKIRITVVDANGNQTSAESNGYFTVHDTSAPPPAPWTTPTQITTVPTTGNGQKKDALGNIVTDASGTLHMAYVFNHTASISSPNPYQVDSTIYYRTLVGSAWSTSEVVAQVSQMVSSVATGTPPPPVVTIVDATIAVSPSGTPSIIWAQQATDGSTTTTSYYYSTRLNGTWTSPFNLASNSMPTMVVDGLGRVDVAWFDGATQQIKFLTNNGSGWAPVVAVNAPAPAYPTLLIDSANVLHLIYEQYLVGITETRWNGSIWSAPQIDVPTSANIAYSSVRGAIDSANNVHLLWEDQTSSPLQLYYAHSNAGLWSVPELIISSANIYQPWGLNVDSLNRPHVTYVARNSSTVPMLFYTLKLNGQWITPLQLNPTSQNISNGFQTAINPATNQMYVAWNYFVNGAEEVFLNHADVSFTTDIFPPNVVVTGPSPGITLSPGSMTNLVWNATDSGGVASVDLAYSTNAGITWNPIASGIANSGAYNWSVPDALTTSGQIRVTARDNANNSDAGFSGAFTIADLTAPSITIAAPAGGSTVTGGSSTNIMWAATDNVGVSKINIEDTLDGGATWLPIALALPNTGNYSWNVPNTPTTGLLLRVTAFDDAGFQTSSTSATPLTIVRANTPPLTPYNPLPQDTNLGTGIAGSVLQWNGGDPDGDAVTYQLNFGTTSTPSAIWSGTDTSYSLPVLNYQTTYFWQVVASDGLTTTAGPVWSFTTAAAPASAPVGMTASKGTFLDRVRVSWPASPGAAGYEIWRSNNGDLNSAQLLGQVTSLTYDDMNAQGSATYTYWVRPLDASFQPGEFSASDSGFRATQLAFGQQPATLYVGQKFGSPIVVNIEDADGNLITTDNSAVTLNVLPGSAGGSLGGTVTVQAQNGVATFSNVWVPKPGSYTLQATDGSFVSTTSGGITGVLPPTHLVMTSMPTGTIAGHPITPVLLVKVEDASGHVVTSDNSTVTIALSGNTNGATLGGTLNIAAVNGIATFSDLALTKTGSYMLSATDGILIAAKSGNFNITPDSATSHLLVAVTQPSVVGKSITPAINVKMEDQFNNVVTSDRSKVTISIVNGPGATESGTSNVTLSNGAASFSNLAISLAGDYTLVASDNNIAIAPVQFSQTITPGVTSVAPPVPAHVYVFGTTITLSTTFKSNAATSVPFTGNATITYGGGTPLGIPANLSSSGAVKFVLPGVLPGSYDCTINYAGDANHTAVTSPDFTLLINPAPTTTTLKPSATQLFSGQPLTLTASVSSSNASSTARTGSITFKDGTNIIGTVSLDINSVAVLSIPTPSVGTHAYTAVYSSDSNFKASTSSSHNVTIKKDTVLAVVLPYIGVTLVPGQPLILSASVVITAGVGTPTGLVVFKDGSTILGSAALDSTGKATLPTAFTTAGTHNVTISYSGDALTNAASSGASKFVVSKANTQVSFTSPNSTIGKGLSTTFTVQVAALAPGVLTPSGKVIIRDGGRTVATLTLSGGEAMWTTPTNLSLGQYLLTALYQGDTNDTMSISVVAPLTVE